MKTIICITLNPSIDKNSSVAHVTAERKLYCQTPRFEPGGGGVNVSRAIQKLGGTSTLFYPQGGLSGQLLDNLLKEEGVKHKSFHINGTIRENLIILETSTGYQFRFGMPGPEIREEEWRKCLDEISRSKPKVDYIVASGSLPAGMSNDFYGQIAFLGKKTGARVIVDAPSHSLKSALKEGVYLIKPNIREFRELFDEDIMEEPHIKEKAKELVTSGQSEVVVISLGAGGVITAFEKTVKHIIPPTVPVVSKVGAGDSMVAGIVLSLSKGMPVYQAVNFGVAAGNAAVMTPGTELLRREDTERLYKDISKEQY